jgi:hypothetical protein
MTALDALTLFHTAISLVGIASGFVVIVAMRSARIPPTWTFIFLASTVATSVTGFLFPFVQFLPAHGVGIVSLVALSIALFALYKERLAGNWRLTYAVAAALSLYLNVFVLVAQLFRRVPTLHALAPTETEPPFAIAEALVLIAFFAFAFRPVRSFAALPAASAHKAAHA